VRHIGVRVQSGQHNDSANNNLGENSNNKAPSQEYKIASIWTTNMRKKNSGNHAGRYNPGE